MDMKEGSARTREIEEPTNLHFIHPIGLRLTPVLARLGISPNTVSFTGMACGVLAGYAYYHYQDIRYAVAGFLLMIVWHILDGVDGQLARLTGRQSELGKIVDGIADNITFLAVYVGLGFALSQSEGIWIWLIIALAGAAHSLQAAAYEAQRQEYDFWGWNKKSAELKSVEALRGENELRPRVWRIVYGTAIRYVRMQHLVSGIDPEFRDRLADMLSVRGDRAESIRSEYRESFGKLVRTWSVMSANYRTIMIFACAAMKKPLAYFLIELLVLTPLMVVLIMWRKKKCREFSRLSLGP